MLVGVIGMENDLNALDTLERAAYEADQDRVREANQKAVKRSLVNMATKAEKSLP